MSRRSHRTKGVVEFTGQHRVGRSNGGAGGAQGGLPAMAIEQRVAVNRVIVGFSCQRQRVVMHQADRVAGMHPPDIFQAGQRRFTPLQKLVDAAGNQLVFNRLQSHRRFRMPVPHFVAQAIGMRVKGGRHFYSRFENAVCSGNGELLVYLQVPDCGIPATACRSDAVYLPIRWLSFISGPTTFPCR